MTRSDFLVVDEPKTVPGRSLSILGPGTPTTRLSYTSNHMLAGYGCLDEKLGDIPGNWNGEDIPLLSKMPRGVRVFAPRKVLPGLPYGFRGDPRLCEQTRHLWEPQLVAWFKEARRLSAQHFCLSLRITHSRAIRSPSWGFRVDVLSNSNKTIIQEVRRKEQ